MARKAILNEKMLELLGLSVKDFEVYVALLRLGTAPLRRIAEEAGLNRGTAYDALKRLLDVGLVSYVDARTHRYFTGEDPRRLRGLATRREVAIREVRDVLDEAIPALESARGLNEHRPAVRYYEAEAGVRDILEDVLETTERAESREYRVYSSAGIRDLISSAWPGFVDERIRRKIRVKAIAIGAGGTTAGLDERRWLTMDLAAPTYRFLYGDKSADVSVDRRKRLFGVIIENPAIAQSSRLIFDALWNSLE